MIYKIEATKGNTIIQVFGQIGQGGFTFTEFKRLTEGLESGTLTIELNSKGGDPYEAFAIHDLMKSLSVRVVVKIMGTAASAATIIAAGADEVIIAENAQYLIHEASAGNIAGKKGEIQDAANELERIDKQMLSVYMKRTGKPAPELEKLMQADKFLTANEALEMGFVDKIEINHKLKQIQAMAEEQKKEETTAMDDLKKENAELKAKLDALIAKLKTYEQQEDEEKEALIESKIKAGVITAESRKDWSAMSHSQVKRMLAGLVEKTEDLSGVPNPKKPDSGADSVEKFEAAYKAGAYINDPVRYEADYKKVYNIKS